LLLLAVAVVVHRMASLVILLLVVAQAGIVHLWVLRAVGGALKAILVLAQECTL